MHSSTPRADAVGAVRSCLGSLRLAKGLALGVALAGRWPAPLSPQLYHIVPVLLNSWALSVRHVFYVSTQPNSRASLAASRLLALPPSSSREVGNRATVQ